jgi:hypothetical protein
MESKLLGTFAMSASGIAISDPRLHRLYDYWLSKKGDRIAPSRADIEPGEIVDLLPWVFLMEKVGTRLRYRLVGEAFREVYGARLMGRYIDEVDLDHITAAYIGEYEQAEREPAPIVRKWNFIKHDGRHLDYERLILPLSPDNLTITMFLGGAVGFGYG